MWQGKRRLRRLEKEIAEARAGQAALQRRVDLFEQIAASAGAALDDPLAAPVPSSLLAAARDLRPKSFPVRLAVNGREVIAVIGGEGGDPREWWTAIRRLESGPASAGHRAGRVMTRIERIPLAYGLQAAAYRDKNDDLVVYVSDMLEARQQRAAVMEAIRASRRTDWWTGLLPPAGVALLVGLRTWLWRGVTVLKAQPVAWAAGTTATVTIAATAGAFITAAPSQHRHTLADRPPAPVTAPSPRQQGSQPGSQNQASGGHQGQAQPAAASQPGAPGAPGESSQGRAKALPTPAPSGSQGSPGSPPQGTPAPAPSGSPSPSPSPSPSSSPKGDSCVILLGVWVCVPPLTASLTVKS